MCWYKKPPTADLIWLGIIFFRTSWDLKGSMNRGAISIFSIGFKTKHCHASKKYTLDSLNCRGEKIWLSLRMEFLFLGGEDNL